MAIRTDNSTAITLNNVDQFDNKSDIREYLLNQWIQEPSASKFRYFVETLANGSRIYLERPGRLNKGCDFVIYLEDIHLWQNGNDRPPDHNYILDDLTLKKQVLSQQEWNSLLNGIVCIHNCETYNQAIQHLNGVPVVNGQSYELLLKTIRWFFIEQDITYWSGQGRDMFLSAIQNL